MHLKYATEQYSILFGAATYDTGPVRSIAVQGIHFAPSRRQIVQYQTHSVYYAHHGNASDLLAFPELSSV